ncbi:MAG: DUF429 domain-containing protein [Myxococcota bacterium]
MTQVRSRFVGVDLTAGVPETAYDTGPLPFPAVLLARGATLELEDVRTFTSLRAFREWVEAVDPTGLAIDGPCGAVGIALDAERRRFVFDAPDTRPAERELVKAGIRLFWTTRKTVESFDGAARWIARSLVVFEDLRSAGRDPVETHPHGVFEMLRRADPDADGLAAKTSADGRRQRLALLAAHLPGLEGARLPDDDFVDAAAAALLAALRDEGRARPYGSVERGGQIWLPQTRSNTSAST